MRRFLLASIIGTTLVAAGAHAQLAVQARPARDTFLLEESIPVEVSIRNFSGRTIELQDVDNKPWLSFIVTDEAGQMIRQIAKLPADDSVLLPAGKTMKHTANLVEAYDLRERGNYRVQARINNAGTICLSQRASFTIINGRELWSRTVGLPNTNGSEDKYRTYALLARRFGEFDSLYVSVRDEPHQLVYGVFLVGNYLSIAAPQAIVDGEGSLHVLFQNAPRSYGYVIVDPSAKVTRRAAYADYLSAPQLAADNDGNVTVRGGEQTYPRPERVLTEDEMKPPPPPEKKSTHKWWWPFGGGQSKPSAERTQ